MSRCIVGDACFASATHRASSPLPSASTRSVSTDASIAHARASATTRRVVAIVRDRLLTAAAADATVAATLIWRVGLY